MTRKSSIDTLKSSEPNSNRPQYLSRGRLLRGLSGLYVIKAVDADTHREFYGSGNNPLAGKTVFCRAKGAFRHEGLTPLCGDMVEFSYTDASYTGDDQGEILPSPDGTDLRIEQICARKNALIRPPMANLDCLFVAVAAACPEPALSTVDKLIAIAEFNHIEPVILLTKCELNRGYAAELTHVYRQAGFKVFPLANAATEGIEDLRTYIETETEGRVAAFAGASGVGKSTLMNALFPDLTLETGTLSKKTERGRHTTRRVELYALHPDDPHTGYLADTPGFSMLDFVHFDFFDKDDLAETMREFRPYLGRCRYTDCTHTKEEDCAIVRALKAGQISPSRHASYLEMYNALKNKHEWDK